MKTTITVAEMLVTNVNTQNTKVLEANDHNAFVCAQNDNACWHRYLSAMGDCV
jgi:hypothetical protein